MKRSRRAERLRRRAREGAKRGLDIVLSGLLLVLFAPVFALVALAIGLRMGRPVMFRQQRAGRGGRPFTLYKFRSMAGGEALPARVTRADATRAASTPADPTLADRTHTARPDAERLTPLGARLRDWSLDELPQLWNVLKGDMSLVGPRPLLMDYLPLYSAREARRHRLRPGITGWAQVRGRNALAWPERLALDVWYVTHWSLALDLRILLLTLRVVASRHGVRAPGSASMPRFTGSASD
jgi:sugar transferase EpsL